MTQRHRRTLVVPAEEGTVRALIVQGTQAQLGPARVGVMSVRSSPGAPPRARLRVMLPDTTRTCEVAEGEVLDLDRHGQLAIVGIRPQDPGADGPETPSQARGHVRLVWQRAEATADGA